MEGPYRAPRPLSDAIRPDRRKERAIAFGFVCMVVGGLLCKGIGLLLEPQAAAPPLTGFATSPPDLSTPPMQPVSITPEPVTFATDDVAKIAASERGLVRDRCWRASPSGPREATYVKVDLVVDPTGNVISSRGDGNDDAVANCVAAQAMAWRFPAHHGGDAHVTVPFVFARN